MANRQILRTDYISELDSFRKDRDLIKVITGVRRCGKSELMKQFRQHLMNNGVPESEIIYIDLEFDRYRIDSERMLYDTIKRRAQKEGTYLLIDEVQLIHGWERVITTVKNELKANIYITGSNSKVLSNELATHLTGRFVTIHVMPLSFREYIDMYPIDDSNGYTQRLQRYLMWGGMPIIDADDSPAKNTAVLRAVFDSIVNNDIRRRIEIDQSILENLTTFMMSNVGNLTSSNRIREGAYLGDPRTAEKYLDELEKCYLFYKADRYDILGAKHLRTNAKFYPVDMGLMNSILYGHEIDESASLECAVFLELKRRGYSVSVGSFKNKEIDFTAWKPNSDPEFFQVAVNLNDPRTLARELDSFRKMDIKYRKVLITMDRDIYDVPDGVEVIHAVDWLLGDY